nr:MAG TPA: hypothetical protein [Caudoviricetes sp.]
MITIANSLFLSYTFYTGVATPSTKERGFCHVCL